MNLFVVDDVHREVILRFPDLALQILEWDPLQVPLCVDALDQDVGLLWHSASQVDDLLESEVLVDPISTLTALPVGGVQVGTGVPYIHAMSFSRHTQ